MEALSTAYGLEPMSRPVNEVLGRQFLARGDFVRARQHFERIDQLQDKDSSAWKERIAGAFIQSGEIARGIVEARQILAVYPGNTNVMDLRIIIIPDLSD